MKTAAHSIGDVTVEVYSFDLIDNRMYVIRSGREVLVIDPFPEPDLVLSQDSDVTILLTHEHYDHIFGINEFKEHYSCRVFAGEKCRDILHSDKNGTERFPFLFLNDKEKFRYVRENFVFPYRTHVDESFAGERTLDFAGHTIFMKEVPAHSKGSIMIFLDDAACFAGDNLLGNEQELKSIDSNREVFYEMLREIDGKYSDDLIVFPGHGDAGTYGNFKARIREYKR